MNTEQNTALEVPLPRFGRRRRFSTAEKRKILGEAESSDETISSVGRRYGLSVSLLFRWKRQLDQEAAAARAGTSAVGKLRARLAQMEQELQSLKRDNVALRESLERGGRASSLPSLSSSDVSRPGGRA